MNDFIMLIPVSVLIINSVRDIKKRMIFPLVLIGTAVGGTVYKGLFLQESWVWTMLSFIPGMLILAASLISKEQIGKGDALAVFAAGAWSGALDIWKVMLFSSLFTAVFAGIIWIKKKKNAELPYVPFLTAGFLINWIC